MAWRIARRVRCLAAEVVGQPLGGLDIRQIHYLTGNRKAESGTRQRGKMALTCRPITRPGGERANPPPCRMAQRRRKLAIGGLLIGGGERRVNQIGIDGMLLKTAADVK